MIKLPKPQTMHDFAWDPHAWVRVLRRWMERQEQDLSLSNAIRHWYMYSCLPYYLQETNPGTFSITRLIGVVGTCQMGDRIHEFTDSEELGEFSDLYKMYRTLQKTKHS